MLCNVGTMTALQIIRILVIIQLLENTRCQDGFGDREILRYHQMSTNDDQSQMDTLSSYGAIFQRSQNTQALNAESNQYTNADELINNEYNRSPQVKSRKIYHISNPFQNQEDKNGKSQENSDPQDSSAGASNQYASVQYSLPPEEFLQQLRAENQYYQQQLSTPAPNLGFTVTPQPQYQYSTISVSSSGYDTNNQQNSQTYHSTPSPYQYSTPNTFLDNVQSTPSPVTPYLSTPINNNQFTGSQSSSYVSSASPVFLSSPSNLQQYVSSPLAAIHTGSPDYGNSRITTTIGNSLRYDNDPSKKNQLQQYDYSRLSNNLQQYQNDYTTTTTTASPYFNSRQSWQNAMNSLKSLQEANFAQYQNSAYNNNNLQDTSQTNLEGNNDDTHRMESMALANNVYMKYAQPDNKHNNMKIHTRDLEQETGQKNLYSNGDYGWKLTERKPAAAVNNDAYSLSFSRNQMPKISSDDMAVSQMNFHLDASKSQNSDKVSKSTSEDVEAQEFAKAAAKAHDRLKQQQQFYKNNYGQSNIGNDPVGSFGNPYLSNNPIQKTTNNYPYTNTQNDLITASPYYITKIKDNLDTKPKQPFDHDKALKTIVPIDVSNVVSVSESHPKTSINLENINRYNLQSYGKDQQNHKEYLSPGADSYYKDKNSVYSFNINSKPNEYVTPESPKQLETFIYEKYQNQQSQEKPYNSITNYASLSQNPGYTPQISNYQDNYMQASGLHNNRNEMSRDIAGIFKVSEVPYRLTQGLSSDALQLHNINFDQGTHIIPTPLPTRLNQNVDSHQLEVATSLLNKLLLNKQLSENVNRPEINNQADVVSSINGYKVANPFNVDLKLVADILKGKSTLDDSQMVSIRDHTKHTPIKLDLSQLQSLINNENNGNLHFANDPLNGINNPFMDIYNNARFPYKGVKYSRSEEEEESIIPIVESSNSHPIGAVMEQSDPASDREVRGVPDITGQDDNLISTSLDDNRSKPNYQSLNHNVGRDRHRNTNLLTSGRPFHQRKYPKADVEEPYPLLKPPPLQATVTRHNYSRMEKNNRRRRVSKPKYLRVLKTEPLYEAGNEPENSETSMPLVLRPSPHVAEVKSDTFDKEQTT